MKQILDAPGGTLLLVGSVGMVAAIVAAWLLVAAVLSIFPIWILLPGMIFLSTYAFTRQSAEERRQARIDAGYCAACGYDLRATRDRCPECGRDARLDEPAFRRLRRTYAEAAAREGAVTPAIEAELPVIPPSIPPAALMDPLPLWDSNDSGDRG